MGAPAIKLCGLTDTAAIDAAISARAQWAGLVFHPPSPRHLDLETAHRLSAHAAGRIGRVGLFVNADDDLISAALAATPLDALQFHGDETPERVARVSAHYGLPVWKALPIALRADLARVADYAGAAALVLLDAKTPKGTLPGGMGISFDWNLLTGWHAPCPWGLAGGLRPDNVAEAVRRTNAPLVDASSGIESAPGVKAPALIAKFCLAAQES